MYRKLLRAIALLSIAATVFGCADKSAEQDAELKPKLLGTWYSTWVDADFGDTRHLLVRVREDGRFESRALVFYKDGSRIDEKTSGEWFVTAGLFKRLHKTLDGKDLAPGEYRYETCRIVTLLDTHLDCAYDLAKGQNNYERVPDTFQVPVK